MIRIRSGSALDPDQHWIRISIRSAFDGRLDPDPGPYSECGSKVKGKTNPKNRYIVTKVSKTIKSSYTKV
jgi:hypothetical protein